MFTCLCLPVRHCYHMMRGINIRGVTKHYSYISYKNNFCLSFCHTFKLRHIFIFFFIWKTFHQNLSNFRKIWWKKKNGKKMLQNGFQLFVSFWLLFWIWWCDLVLWLCGVMLWYNNVIIWYNGVMLWFFVVMVSYRGVILCKIWLKQLWNLIVKIVTAKRLQIKFKFEKKNLHKF